MLKEYELSIHRRLPIYLILDTSRSMGYWEGMPIQAVNEGLRLLKEILMEDPAAIELAYISVITFSTGAEQIVPLTELLEFSPPELKAGGWSEMGAALRLLNEVLDREIILNTPEQKGDYRPLIFLMTDGRPSDSWKRINKALRSRSQIKLSNLVALGCGPKADMQILSQVADVALLMDEITPEAIKAFFKWVSQSVGTASLAMSTSGGGGGAVKLPPLPSYIQQIVL